MNNKIEITTKELYKRVPDLLLDLFRNNAYPWQILPKIKETILFLIEKGIEGYSFDKDKNILIGKNVRLSPTATIIGPTIIGNNVEIRPGAYIRGNVIIMDDCVIGNSSEIKNSILLEHVQIPHYNYVGDSILGYHSHLGAGVICSNLRNDNQNVIIHGDKEYPSSLRKVGAFIGEFVDVGCNSVLNPGTIISSNSKVYPLTTLRGVYPSNVLIKETKNWVNLK